MFDLDKLISNKEFNPERKVKLPCMNENSCNGDCCGAIPLKKEFVQSMWVKYKLSSLLGKFKHAKYTKSEVIGTRKYFNKDSMCIFHYNGKCLIYEDRPGICKAYGETHLVRCPYENLETQPTGYNKIILINNNNELRDKLILNSCINFYKKLNKT